MQSNAAHWDAVYTGTSPHRVSWFAPRLGTSLRLLREAGLATGTRLIDVGAGASTLVDDALALGAEVTALDLADAALAFSRYRLGEHAAAVHWQVGDVREVVLPRSHYDLWHDRAVLHFLADPTDAARYAEQAAAAVKRGGHLVVAGFAPDGPLRCSGLDVARRSLDELDLLFDHRFVRIRDERETHRTPGGAEQAFLYAVYRRTAAA